MTDQSNLNVPRSLRPAVRNPLIEMPAAQQIRELPKETRQHLRALLLDMRASAQAKAEKSWRSSKAPMAMYWKVVAVYTGHIARLLR